MKKLLLLIVCLSFTIAKAQQVVDADDLVHKCMEQVRDIDNQVLFKVPYSYGKYGWDNYEYNNGNLKKSILT